MRIELSPYLAGDLEAIGDFIALDKPMRAASFIREIRGKFRKIAEGPLHYRLRPDIGPEARVAVHGNYLILFRVVASVVRIERVIHGGRDIPLLFE